MTTDFDEDALHACIDLVGRTGATDFEIGYLRDEETEGHPVAPHEAGWYARCNWKGNKLAAEEQPGPNEAVDALSRRLLAGGQCTHCKQTITLSSREEGCRWRRMGPKWERGCIPGPKITGPKGAGKSVAP